MLATGLIRAESCWGQSKSLGAAVTQPLAWLILCTQLSQYVSALQVSGWGETKACPLCSALKGSPAGSPFPGGELSVAEKLPLGREQRWPREKGDTGTVKLFFLSFLCGYSQIFVVVHSTCCWGFLIGLLSFPRAVFVCG